jgi:hypothetical protein
MAEIRNDMNPTSPTSGRTAVVCAADAPQAAALRARGLESAAWYAPRDVDHLEEAVRTGQVNHVIWLALADLLTPVWDSLVRAETWLQPGLRLEFVEAVDPALAQAILRAWSANCRRRRRVQIVGGLILSAVALLCAFGLAAV